MNYLSEYVRNQARWREEKSEEYPDDERNARSAEALVSLADYIDAVERGTMDDEPKHWTMPVLRSYFDRNEAGTGVPSAGEKVVGEISRYGFGYPVPNDWRASQFHADFLDELVPVAVEDIYEEVGEYHQDADRSDASIAALAEEYDLQPWEVEAALDGLVLGSGYFKRRGSMTEEERQAWIDAEREEER